MGKKAKRMLSVQSKKPLMPLPDSIPEAHRSRNNQLILHALSQIDGLIQTAIARYGKERVAVVTGTSTSGADEKYPFVPTRCPRWCMDGCSVQTAATHHGFASEFIAQVYGLDGLRYTVSTACTSAHAPSSAQPDCFVPDCVMP